MTELKEIEYKDLVDLLSFNPNENYKAHIKTLNEKINARDLSEYIIIKSYKSEEFIEGVVDDYLTLATITFKNLEIKIINENNETGFLNIVFPSNFNIMFQNNTFYGLNLTFIFPCQGNTNAQLANNIFEMQYVTIVADIPVNFKKEDISSLSDTQKIIITNNKFKTLDITDGISFFFSGENTIDYLLYKRIPSDIYWGLSQKLDIEGNFPNYHKKLFIKLKKRAIENNDRFQELTLNRELINIETALLKHETDSLGIYQTRFVLWIGWLFSNHGTSWFRPLGCLMIANIIIAGYYSHSGCPITDYWWAYWQLLHPLSNLLNDVSQCKSDKNILYFLIGSQKLFYAGMIYETIRVFRRFTAK